MPLQNIPLIKEYIDKSKPENVNENSDKRECHNYSAEVQDNETKGDFGKPINE
jgi:hypothetical protein